MGVPGSNGTVGAVGVPGAAGTPGTPGSPGAPGPVTTPAPAIGGFSVASMSVIYGMTFDPTGNLWLLSQNTTGSFDVNEFTSASIVASPGAYSSPTPALFAQNVLPNSPAYGFAVDTAGDVFVGNGNGINAFVSPLMTGKTPTTTAFTFSRQYPAAPNELALDAAGTLYAIPNSAAIDTFSNTAGVIAPGAPITGAAIVNPNAITSDSAGNLLELENTASYSQNTNIGNCTINSFTSGTSTGAATYGSFTTSAQIPISDYCGKAVYDKATGYTYAISYDGNQQIAVYAPYSGTTSSLLPIATISLGQYANSVGTIAVDTKYLYVANHNNVTLYPKYDPLHPYASYRKITTASSSRKV